MKTDAGIKNRLTNAIDFQNDIVKNLTGVKNPQVVELCTKAEIKIDLLEAVFDCIQGDSTLLEIEGGCVL